MDLVLERNSDTVDDKPVVAGNASVMITPAINEDYWSYRVQLGGGQAIVGFPKFSTVGIGFAQEEDWNSNLPFRCSTATIWRHIAHNKGAATATDEECQKAIDMVAEAVVAERGGARDLDLNERGFSRA